MAKHPLIELLDYGQSFWLDNIRREWLSDGTLEGLVRDSGLRGLTSNPAILQKAITGSRAYDGQLETLVQAGASTMAVYEGLVISDIQGAADVLRPVYDASGGEDGYVSLEVSPLLAHDTQRTVAQAKRLFAEVERPNVMIKVPGTPAGVPAIEELVAAGININVTLLFSTQQYEASAQAYLRGLERRHANGEPLDVVASVASVFLSRIDNLVDALIGQRIQPGVVSPELASAGLLGKTAVACAKNTYARFKALFSGPRWDALAAAGARVQRPLWASTSTKNPLYHDVCYVEPLIGAHTVNTLPDATVEAFGDHGRVADTIEQGLDDARSVLEGLGVLGIDIDDICRQLQDEGVVKFIKPFGVLLASLDERRAAVLADRQVSHTFQLGGLTKKVDALCSALDEARAVERLWAADPSLWRQDEAARAAIANRLGWLGLPHSMEKELDEVIAFADEVRNDGMKTVVLLGMGGSSLTTDVASKVFGQREGFPELRILDSTHPDAVNALTESIDLDTTLFIVASKSGTTLETMSLYRHFTALEDQQPGTTGKHFIAITDPDTTLVATAKEQGFRRVFINPPDVGGRFSALSFFGLIPMAIAGIDVRTILAHARELAERTGPHVVARHNPGFRLGVLMAAAQDAGRAAMNIVTPAGLSCLGDWLEQLVAESTGKHGQGVLPIVREPLGDFGGEFGADRFFTFVRLAGSEAEQQGQIDACVAAGHPVYVMTLPGAEDIGQAFLCWELATAVAGVAMGINPFDEPDVRSAKQATTKLLDVVTRSGQLPPSSAPRFGDGLRLELDPTTAARVTSPPVEALEQILDEANAQGRYVAIMAYVASNNATDDALAGLRAAIRSRWPQVATTVGYGPRLLHSIGQLYKGGPNRGTFIQLVDPADHLLAIPGQRYDFGILVSAQAQGDFQALTERGRTAARVLVQTPVDGIKALAKALSGA